MKLKGANRYFVFIFPLGVVLGGLLWWQGSTSSAEGVEWIHVQKGNLAVDVVAAGEFTARQAIELKAPDILRTLEIYQLRIVDIIPEGSLVKKGDYIATLDRNELNEKIRQLKLEIDNLENQRRQALLDTALQLRQAREEIQNLQIESESQKIQLRGIEYEAPSEQAQIRLHYQRTLEQLGHAREAYQLKRRQLVSKIFSIENTLKEARHKYELAQQALQGLSLHAPTDGVVIYHTDWNGAKKQAGSLVSSWDPVVVKLSLEDELISVARVHELDLHKIRIGQPVQVETEAYAQLSIQGEVSSIASSPENSEQQVRYFKVSIRLHNPPKQLRPGMSSLNRIRCGLHRSVLFVPLASIHYDPTGRPFVVCQYKGRTYRQEVKLGVRNDLYVAIERGLMPGARVSILLPDDYMQLPWHDIEKP